MSEATAAKSVPQISDTVNNLFCLSLFQNLAGHEGGGCSFARSSLRLFCEWAFYSTGKSNFLEKQAKQQDHEHWKKVLFQLMGSPWDWQLLRTGCLYVLEIEACFFIPSWSQRDSFIIWTFQPESHFWASYSDAWNVLVVMSLFSSYLSWLLSLWMFFSLQKPLADWADFLSKVWMNTSWITIFLLVLYLGVQKKIHRHANQKRCSFKNIALGMEVFELQAKRKFQLLCEVKQNNYMRSKQTFISYDKQYLMLCFRSALEPLLKYLKNASDCGFPHSFLQRLCMCVSICTCKICLWTNSHSVCYMSKKVLLVQI